MAQIMVHSASKNRAKIDKAFDESPPMINLVCQLIEEGTMQALLDGTLNAKEVIDEQQQQTLSRKKTVPNTCTKWAHLLTRSWIIEGIWKYLEPDELDKMWNPNNQGKLNKEQCTFLLEPR